ncbi:hypothetical protein MMC18_000103 [Xylographa bjoerkii]|nr:hypothetical protein [Xylographa bjoerkii]
MSSAVAELDGILQSMLDLKAPGVNNSKITSITQLCNANVQSETVLIQKIYTHFKKAPGTHKLGVLYVVDSVTRQWLDQARKAGQIPSPSAADGTFAAGVNHVTELLPSFMTDILNTCPDEQKVKIRKLIDIWERGNTFPAAMLSNFKDKLSAPTSNAMQSTTPVGTPPQDFISVNPPHSKMAAPVPDTSAILANLQALANMAKQNPTGPTVPGNTAQGSSSNVTFPQNTFSNISSVNPNSSVPTAAHVNVPGAQNLNGVFSYPGMNPAPQNFVPNPSNGLSNVQAAPQSMMPQANGVSPEVLQQQLQLLQALRAQNVPQEQWAPLLAVLMANNAAGSVAAPTPAAYGTFGSGRDDASRDRNGYDQHYRSPPRAYRNRSRSRSPPRWDRGRESPPRRRDSPVYGEFGNDRNGKGGDYGRRGGAARGRGNGFRARSPDRFRRSPSPTARRGAEQPLPPPGPKWIQYDPSIGEGMIKVLSRTLFVGGVTSSEDDLRAIFLAFGRVQTCIVNVDKRHAFVKMITRDEAMRAKEGMEHYKSPDMQLRTRWGVGFGPRDCSDYQTGISIIPIERLTDADRKWMLTAEFGGTGGKPIESGLVVEEPDIEIGAGVSSKAISRRMQTDKGGQQGPRSSRDPPPPASRFRAPERRDEPERSNSSVGAPPAVPGFGFQFPLLPNGMPMFPPGFVMPGQQSSQPPPPGAT